MANPTLLSIPIAENGNKNALPLNQSSPGQMSQDAGFPPETSLPLGAGGVAPSREDFNGAFNLLGGVAFYAQKGFSFNYDSGQDYYAGCVVIDAADGKRYQCIANMTAGTVSPSNDTTHTYWKEYTIDNLHTIGAFNKKETFTTSGSFTAPVTGVYRITLQGGGGGGGGAGTDGNGNHGGGGGGGSGAQMVLYEQLVAGTSYAYTIGAGGAGGVGGSLTTNTGNNGGNGGDTKITINSNEYSAGGGAYGASYAPTTGGYQHFHGGSGGGLFNNGVLIGVSGYAGGSGQTVTGSISTYVIHGGEGGGAGSAAHNDNLSYLGAGGAGGWLLSSTSDRVNGVAGGDGYITFEYYDPTI